MGEVRKNKERTLCFFPFRVMAPDSRGPLASILYLYDSKNVAARFIF